MGNELFRQSLAELLKTRSGLEIAGEAGNGKELLELMKYRDAGMVLLDSDMPTMDGRETMEVLRVRFPDVKVIILSSKADPYISDYMSRGASCYLTTACSTGTLFKAIECVSKDGYYFDDTIARAMLGALRHQQDPSVPDEVVFNERETDIIRAICDGKTNKQIADRFHISASTVDFYKSRIYKKTKCRNSTSLLKYALKRGIIGLT